MWREFIAAAASEPQASLQGSSLNCTAAQNLKLARAAKHVGGQSFYQYATHG